MKRAELLRAAALVVCFCAAFWVLFFSGLLSAPTINDAAEANSFQHAFWVQRPLDLALQACLIITGALGVAAILPAEDEE